MINQKTKRDQLILMLLKKFPICSRNQIASLLFNQNSRPVNVCNRVLKRMVMEGKIKQVKRERDQTYLYCQNPASIHPKSPMINHYLKMVDFYIKNGCPNNFLIEPILGSYEPDIMFRDKNNKTICVEIQLTRISIKRMQEKVNQFVKEYGKNHDSLKLIICSERDYTKLTIPKGFTLIHSRLPNEPEL